MAFVPILDLLVYHRIPQNHLLYRYSASDSSNSTYSQNIDLLLGAIQSLCGFSSRLNEQCRSLSTLATDDGRVYFDPLVSSFKNYKTAFYSLYYYETATGFQFILITGQPQETHVIKGPYCRTEILDAGSGEGSQFILQHYYKTVVVNGIILNDDFVALDFGRQDGSWTAACSSDIADLFSRHLGAKTEKFFSDLSRL